MIKKILALFRKQPKRKPRKCGTRRVNNFEGVRIVKS